MTDAILNQLLEEATNRAIELTAEAEEATAAASALGDRAEALEATLTSRGEETLRRFREMEGRLAAASERLQAAGDEAAVALDDVETQAGQVRSRVGDLLTSARASLEELSQKADQVRVNADRSADEAVESLERVDDQAERLQTDVDGQLREAESEIASFRDAVAAARTDFERAKESFREALTRLNDEAVEQAHGTTQAVNDALAEMYAVHESMRQRIIEANLEAIREMQRVFGEAVPAGLPAAFKPFEEALDSLALACADAKAMLTEETPKTVQDVGEVETAVTAPNPTMRMAATVCS